mmetsp:Transcript_7920/g.23852  ORF Transcript_7920/g.23852 Transcript_7920/m.23852 type:complete len:656 (+) Transcript_7920:64-2031(+)
MSQQPGGGYGGPYGAPMYNRGYEDPNAGGYNPAAAGDPRGGYVQAPQAGQGSQAYGVLAAGGFANYGYGGGTADQGYPAQGFRQEGAQPSYTTPYQPGAPSMSTPYANSTYSSAAAALGQLQYGSLASIASGGSNAPAAGSMNVGGAPFAQYRAPANAGGGISPGMQPVTVSQPPAGAGGDSGGNDTSIWTGDLDPFMDEAFLRNAVTQCGWGHEIVDVRIVRQRGSGNHAGYGFLSTRTPDDARRITAMANGTPIPGTLRSWRLNYGRNGGDRSSGDVIEANVFAGDLDPSVSDFDLMQLFRSRYPSVRHCKVMCDATGKSRGFAFVRFGSKVEADRSVHELNGYPLKGRMMKLNVANKGKGQRQSQDGPQRGGDTGAQQQFHAQPPPPAPYGSGYSSYNLGPGGYGLPASGPVAPAAVGGYGGGAATSRPETGGGKSRGSGKRARETLSPNDPRNSTLFIGGISSSTTEDILRREFRPFGEIDGVKLPQGKTGFGFVRFHLRQCAENAKAELGGKLNVFLNRHKPIRIEWAAEQLATVDTPVEKKARDSAALGTRDDVSRKRDPEAKPAQEAYAAGSSEERKPSGPSQSAASDPTDERVQSDSALPSAVTPAIEPDLLTTPSAKAMSNANSNFVSSSRTGLMHMNAHIYPLPQ